MQWVAWIAASVLAAVVHGDVITDTLLEQANFNTLVNAVLAADIDGALSDASSALTVFAPDDAAFAKIQNVVDFLVVPNEYTRKKLTQVLLYHVLGEEKDKSKVNGVSTTLQGSTVNVKVPSINGGAAKITQANINADGGVIHKIDSVLIPPRVYHRHCCRPGGCQRPYHARLGAFDCRRSEHV